MYYFLEILLFMRFRKEKKKQIISWTQFDELLYFEKEKYTILFHLGCNKDLLFLRTAFGLF